MDLTVGKYIFGSLEQVNVVMTNYYWWRYEVLVQKEKMSCRCAEGWRQSDDSSWTTLGRTYLSWCATSMMSQNVWASSSFSTAVATVKYYSAKEQIKKHKFFQYFCPILFSTAVVVSLRDYCTSKTKKVDDLLRVFFVDAPQIMRRLEFFFCYIIHRNPEFFF